MRPAENPVAACVRLVAKPGRDADLHDLLIRMAEVAARDDGDIRPARGRPPAEPGRLTDSSGRRYLTFAAGRYGPGASPNCSRSGPRRILPTGVRNSWVVNSYDRGHLNPARCSRQ